MPPQGQRVLSEPEFNAIYERVIQGAPPGLNEQQFNILVDNEIAKATAPPDNVFTKPGAQSAAEAVTGFVKQGIDQVKGLASDIGTGLSTRSVGSVPTPTPTLDVLPMIERATQARYDAWNKGTAALNEGRTIEGLGYKAAGVLPFIGPGIVSIAENLGSADPERMGRAGFDAVTGLAGTPTGAGAIGNAASKVGARVQAARPYLGPVAMEAANTATLGAVNRVQGRVARNRLAEQRAARTAARAAERAEAQGSGRLVTDPEPPPTVPGVISEALEELRQPEVVELAPSHPVGGEFTTPTPGRVPGSRLVRPEPEPAVPGVLAEALEELRQPEAVELMPSHPSGGEFTTPTVTTPPGRLAPRTAEPSLNDAILEALSEVGDSVELAPSHPSGGGFTTPVAPGRLVPGSQSPTLMDSLIEGLESTRVPDELPPGAQLEATTTSLQHPTGGGYTVPPGGPLPAVTTKVKTPPKETPPPEPPKAKPIEDEGLKRQVGEDLTKRQDQLLKMMRSDEFWNQLHQAGIDFAEIDRPDKMLGKPGGNMRSKESAIEQARKVARLFEGLTPEEVAALPPKLQQASEIARDVRQFEKATAKIAARLKKQREGQ